MSHACSECARRSWLLGRLSVRLDFRARDLSRFWGLLELSDRELIDAIGGQKRAALQRAYEQWKPPKTQRDTAVQTVCRHHAAYPASLSKGDLAPRMLGVLGGLDRLRGMLGQAVVAIVGTRQATDYGMEIAHGLARGLAASGVTVISGLTDGIPSAVHSGALKANCATLTVLAGGLDHCSPACCAALYRRILARGGAISEIPSKPRSSLSGELARARTLALIAQLVIVVEAEERPRELACAQVAQALGKSVAAVPGRVSSCASGGTNLLLMEGAHMVRDPQDALDLLCGVGAQTKPKPSVALAPKLQRVLRQVSGGLDTLAKLTEHGPNSTEIALTLAELELQGLLVRGDGGRYVPTAETLRRAS
jgi:DNA processing protein